MQIHKINMRHMSCVIKLWIKKEECMMFKYFAKLAEKYAKSTNTTCFVFWIVHQPKMPASLINKD